MCTVCVCLCVCASVCVQCLTCPGPGQLQGAPSTPLAVQLHRVTGSNLQLMGMACQGVGYHQGAEHTLQLRGCRVDRETQLLRERGAKKRGGGRRRRNEEEDTHRPWQDRYVQWTNAWSRGVGTAAGRRGGSALRLGAMRTGKASSHSASWESPAPPPPTSPPGGLVSLEQEVEGTGKGTGGRSLLRDASSANKLRTILSP